MSEDFNAWLDRVAEGEKPTVESFAKSALPQIDRVTARVRPPSNKSMWPPEVWEEMQRIWRGEE